MKKIELPLVELFGIAATRGMLGAGLALLFGDHLARRQKRSLGIVLAVIGGLSTLPFARDVFRQRSL